MFIHPASRREDLSHLSPLGLSLAAVLGRGILSLVRKGPIPTLVPIIWIRRDERVRCSVFDVIVTMQMYTSLHGLVDGHMLRPPIDAVVITLVVFLIGVRVQTLVDGHKHNLGMTALLLWYY